MEKIKVIIKRPDEDYGHMTWISNTLQNLQKTVEGPIQTVKITSDTIMICNEEGKLRGLEKNFIMGSVLPDVIVGTVIICGEDGDEFGDIQMSMKTWKYLLDEWGN